MLAKDNFEKMRNEFEQYAALREQLINNSRQILKLSKAAVYALHRKDTSDAESKLAQAKSLIQKAKELIAKDQRLASVGAYNEGLEEFVEASCLAGFIRDRQFPNPEELEVSSVTYLMGVCDVVGELVRKAINGSIAGDFKIAAEIQDFVKNIYEELMLFDFPNSQLRRKFDSIKYGLEKLENLVLELKLKDKLD